MLSMHRIYSYSKTVRMMVTTIMYPICGDSEAADLTRRIVRQGGASIALASLSAQYYIYHFALYTAVFTASRSSRRIIHAHLDFSVLRPTLTHPRLHLLAALPASDGP
jgi:hypothetical protein